MSSCAESPSRIDPRQESTPERRGARRIVSPFRCRIWTQHSRPEEQLTDNACKSLRESFLKNGQHQPALGRPVSDDPDCDIEIICGVRRHAVARSLARDLLVEVRHMTDAEAYVAMYEENLLREGDSPYVRGQILLHALRSRTYPSQEELGRAFNLSHSAVSRLLMVGQLPSLIVAAFRSPCDIREHWGIELYRLWTDKGRHQALATKARAIANMEKRPLAREIYETLLAPHGSRETGRRLHRNIPIRGTSGAIVGHEQDHLERVTYIIPKTILSPTRRDAIRQFIARVLEGEEIQTDG